VIFYFLATLIIILALATVFTKQILRSAVYLMGVLTLSAGLYLILGAEFLSGVQVLVYVGGIVVLLVFAVMLTQSEDLLEDRPSSKRKFLGALAAIGFFASSLWVIAQTPLVNNVPMPQMPANSGFSIAAIGKAFLSTEANGFLVPFELISILLLAVLIAGIVIARKEKLR
jgi:NADH-quinone oxidoreductase subunit J